MQASIPGGFWWDQDTFTESGEIFAGELISNEPPLSDVPLGTSQVSFRCELVSQTDPSQTSVAWADPGFSIDITGPAEPMTLNTYQAEPGQTLYTTAGAPDGPEGCPDVSPSKWSFFDIGADWPGDPGIELGNLGSFSPYAPASQYSFTVPADTPPGYYWLGAACGTFNSDGTFSAFNYEDAYLQVGDPSTLDAAPVGGPLAASETYGAENPAEAACSCAVGWSGDPVNTATGDYAETDTDSVIPGKGPYLDATRTYNSLDAGVSGPFGNGWTFSYGAHLVIDSSTGSVTVVQGDDAQVSYSYDASSGTFTAPPRVTATLVKNADGTYVFETHRRGVELVYRFGPAGDLERISDANGYATTVSHPDASHEVVADPSGRMLTYTLTGGHVTSLTDPTGNVTTYTYDGSGDLVKVVDPLGRTITYSYNSVGEMLTRVDPRGGTLAMSYDSSGKVVRQTDAMGRTTEFDYTSLANATKITDPDGNVTVDHYENGFLVAETQGYGTTSAATWEYQHDPNTGGQTVVIDPNGSTTYRTYDADGNVLTSIDPLGNETTYTYNSFDEPTSITSPLRRTAQDSYDSAGNLTKTVDPLGNSTSYAYDPSRPGEVTEVTDPDGHTTRFGYDNAGDRTSVTDPLGNQTTTTYDADSRPLTVAAPNGGTTRDAYDADGEITQITDPLGKTTTYTYDGDGNQTSMTDANGHKTLYAYDADNEQTRITRPDGTKIKKTYDGDGNVLTQTDGNGHITTYRYDPLDRVTSSTDPAGHQTTNAYDGAGNLISSTDPSGQTTTFAYDADNRVTGISYSDGTTPDVSESYNADGQRTSLSDGTGTSTFSYDADGRLTGETNGDGATTRYGYDQAGHVTAITYPNGKAVSEAYNAGGRLESVTDWLGNTTTFGYDGDGNQTSESIPGSVTSHLTYDAADRLTGITDTGTAGDLASFSYTRDPLGEVTGVTTTGVLPGADTYSYDADSRLTGGDGASYGYDAGDNPTTFAGISQTFNNADELIKASSATSASQSTAFSYDSQGGRVSATTVSGDGQTYTYDQAGRLISVARSAPAGPTGGKVAPPTRPAGGKVAPPTRPAGGKVAPPTRPADGKNTVTNTGTRFSHGSAVRFGGRTAAFKVKSSTTLTATAPAAAYAYNGDGLRMSKTVGGTTTQFAWDDAGSLPLLLQDGSTYYIYGPGGQPIEQITGSTPIYLLSDQQGSTRLLTDSTGTVVGAYSYDAWGRVAKHTGSATTDLQYDGQYTDAETGFQYLRARYYDPATGQFLTEDPAVAVSGQPYEYAADNPVLNSDPAGLFTIQGCLIVVCAGYQSGNGVSVGLSTPDISASVTVGNTQYGLPSRDLGGSYVCYPWSASHACELDAGIAGNGVAIDEQNGNFSVQACGGLIVVSSCESTAGGSNSPAASPNTLGPSQTTLPYLENAARKYRQERGILQSYTGPACGRVPSTA